MTIHSSNPYQPADSRYGDDSNRLSETVAAVGHSGLGIVSFAIAIFSGLSAIGLLVIAGFAGAAHEGGIADDSVLAILIGLGAMAVVAMNVLGVALGIAGVVQTNRQRMFGIMGLFCNVFVSLLLIALTIVGIALDA